MDKAFLIPMTVLLVNWGLTAWNLGMVEAQKLLMGALLIVCAFNMVFGERLKNIETAVQLIAKESAEHGKG